MCESYDVLKSTYQSAPAMTHTFCDYGGGSMGYGIRKFADEMIDTGIKKGCSLGACEGHKIGFAEGRSVGFVEGVIITTVALGVLNLNIWWINRIKEKKRIENNKQLTIKNEKIAKEEFNNAEVQSNIQWWRTGWGF